jgi:hypothetical protein
MYGQWSLCFRFLIIAVSPSRSIVQSLIFHSFLQVCSRMAARSNGHSGADEGLQYAQEGMEPVSAEHSSSYSAFSSFPTDGPIPVNSFSSTHFHESEGSYDENSVSSCIHHVQTQPCDLPVDPKRRKLCRIPQRILLWIVPPALILSWLVAGLVGYEIRHANEHR